MKKNYILIGLLTLKKLLYTTLLFSSVIMLGQTTTLNFTIDTAVDTGTPMDDGNPITETIIDGTDTYVLSILHQGNEELDNLGGGDLVFFLGEGGAIADLPFVISLTRNGNPVNFTLNGMDYDTFGAGTISLENQNGDVISSQAYPLGAGAIAITNTANATDISSFSIIPDLSNSGNELNDFGFHNINVGVQNTLSAEDLSIEESIGISPNPSDGRIMINTKAVEIENIEILDLNGRRVKAFKMNKTLKNEELDLTRLLPSMYVMRVVSSNKATAFKKIIIK